MDTIASLQARRQSITDELLLMRSLHPGNVNEQFVKGRRAGKPVTRGPYPVLCWREGKKVFSQRLTSDEQRQQAQQDTDNYRRFKALCKKFESLTHQLGELERNETAADEALKKGLKSPLSKAKK